MGLPQSVLVGLCAAAAHHGAANARRWGGWPWQG